MKAVLIVSLVMMLLLAGCSGGGKKKAIEVVLPPEITEQDINRLSNLASKFPTAFSFEGQQVLAPVTHWINGTLAPGTGSTGVEIPNDNGPTDYGSEIVAYDVSDKVPVGQPVEVRINLKWFADPGRAADLDIWADMPGETGASDLGRFDESNNWNIANKIRVVNSVHLDGQPFAVGVQVNNGRIFDPSGDLPYSLKIEFHFVANVLPPATPYALQVPENSTLIVIDTERVVGDEHVTVDFVLVGPQDNRVWSMHHNDIGVETLSISVPGGGEYILYAQHMHGGFLRVEAEIPNEDHVARRLELTVEERMLHEGPAPAPGTYAEQSQASSNTFGASGTFDIGPLFPLDIQPIIRTTAGSVDVALNVTGPDGWLLTAFARGAYEDERGRVGSPPTIRILEGRETMDVGTYAYGVVSNSAGASLGVRIVSYTR
jgi:hypothetical protein